MAKYFFHSSDSRGQANHGWLEARHSFSFASYHNPERMHFGVLRVLNDDLIAPGMGFGRHPHDNMEIITIPLEGSLRHQDSMGYSEVITAGEIQVMSAGTGIQHSEFNAQPDKELNLLQIWVFPNKKNVEPRYQQIFIPKPDTLNTFQQILSPNQEDAGVWIHQNAWFSMGDFQKDLELDYAPHLPENGVYVFLIEGQMEVNGQTLKRRDGLGISETNNIHFKALTDNTKVLLMEVPMVL